MASKWGMQEIERFERAVASLPALKGKRVKVTYRDGLQLVGTLQHISGSHFGPGNEWVLWGSAMNTFRVNEIADIELAN